MRAARLVLLSLAATALAACGSAAAPPWTAPTVTSAPSTSALPAGTSAASPSPAPATVSPAATTAATSAGGATRIEIRLSDALKMEPATVTVPAGSPVTFVVTNTGALDHEFYIGDEQAQAAREQAMPGAATAPPDAQNLIGLKTGQTKELTVTFGSPGSSLAGCHIAGHYLAGMKATITIQ
jgi:uncharacterized cupredoxin-like copper-binding protein